MILMDFNNYLIRDVNFEQDSNDHSQDLTKNDCLFIR